MTALFPHYDIDSEGRGCEWDLLKNIWMVREEGKFSKFSWRFFMGADKEESVRR